MSSSVFFRFKSSKEPTRVTFDGTAISVFELKRDIISISGLGDGSDFDLHIYPSEAASFEPSQEYTDDTALIARSSSVIAVRKPAARPGHGKAARYVTGKAPVTAKNLSRSEHARSSAPAKSAPATSSVADVSQAMTEEERRQAIMAAESSQWEQQRQQMAHAKPVFNKFNANRKHVNSDKKLPVGYVCHRCNLPGHWIQDCPTNDDPNFEPKPRLKRTTGIPKTFIKAAPKTNGANVNDGLTDDAQAGTVMLDAEGNQVVVVPDSESWKKFEQKHKAAVAAQQEATAGSESKELQERGLLCPIDKRLFVDPMKTPCCEKTYCHDCIENTLLDTDLVCPNCGQHSVLIDNLKTDDAMVSRIAEYEREKVEREKAAKAEKVTENSPEPAKKEPTNSPKAESIKSPKSPQTSAVKSPPARSSATPSESNIGTPTASAASIAPSKKRRATDEPDWANVPTGPAAMRKQPSQSQPQQMPMPQNMQNMQSVQPFPQQMQFPPFQQFPMGAMPGQFSMQPFQMQQQLPFNNYYGQPNGMGNMNMNMNMNNMSWQQQVPFQSGPSQQNGFRQFNKHQNQQNEESAYLRQPVNPRNQHRNKRARPCDYTTLS